MRDASPSILSTTISDARLCVSFYTLLPVAPILSEEPDTPPNFAAFAAAQWAAPLAGAIIGIIAAGIYALSYFAGLSNLLCSALTLAATIALTGALHEDGLADVADGFGGGRTVERKLAIMKDSRIGTYGVLALIASFTLRLAALTALGAQATPLVVATALIAAHTASRSILPLFMYLVPPARLDGLAAGLGDMPRHTALIALGIGATALLTSGIWPALIMAALLALLIVMLRLLSLTQIKGQTGDVLGTLQQGGEIIVLIAASRLLVS